MTVNAKTPREVCETAPVIPVLVVDKVEHAKPLAEALVRGGLPVLEVTLRTPSALEVIRAMSEVSGALVGAGTLLSPEDVKSAKSAGATFGVSPGSPDRVVSVCEDECLPLLPGVSTVTEVMNMRDRGYEVMKFFPAEPSGGIPALKGIYGPIPDVSFCPTGGVSPANCRAYLEQPNVICVGGSWIAKADLVEGEAWSKIEENARAAFDLAKV